MEFYAFAKPVAGQTFGLGVNGDDLAGVVEA